MELDQAASASAEASASHVAASAATAPFAAASAAVGSAPAIPFWVQQDLKQNFRATMAHFYEVPFIFPLCVYHIV